MAQPKNKISKSRGRKKRTHKKISLVSLGKCSHCGRMVKPHAACSFCGYYRGRQILEIKPVKKEKKNEDLIQLTSKQLRERLDRAKNLTKEEVAEQLKKEFEEKLNTTFNELEVTKTETFTIKENLAITRELFRNDIDN